MTLGNKILLFVQYVSSKIMAVLHNILYTMDEMHPTTDFRQGKKCVNVCTYCGCDNTLRGGVHIAESKKRYVSPIYVGTKGSTFVTFPQGIEAKDILMSREDNSMPLVCMGCGRVYSSVLALKTLDINILLYY